MSTSLEDVRLAVARVGKAPNARVTHWRLVKHLEALGFACKREVRADYSNGLYTRAGKMDVLASRNGEHIGIEIDRNNPRAKSILKLRGFQLSHRIIVLREPMRRPCPYLQGIDAVYVINESGGRGKRAEN